MRLRLSFLVLVVIIFLSGCTMTNTTEKVINSYFTYIKQKKYDEAYLLLSDTDKTDVALTEYREYMSQWDKALETTKTLSPTLYEFLSKDFMNFKIISIIKEKDFDTCEVEISNPDILKIAEELNKLMPDYFLTTPDKLPGLEPQLKAALQKLFPNGPVYSFKKEAYKTFVVKGKRQLSVSLKEKYIPFKSQLLTSDGNSAFKDGELEVSIKSYQDAVALVPANTDAVKGLEEAQAKLIERNKELAKPIDPYISASMSIDEPALNIAVDASELTFKIKNKGNKLLKSITLRLIYQTDAGNIIDIYSFTALAVSPANPLKANSQRDIKEKIKDFPVTLKWQEKKFKLEITEIK